MPSTIDHTWPKTQPMNQSLNQDVVHHFLYLITQCTLIIRASVHIDLSCCAIEPKEKHIPIEEKLF
jgi:hypothetical protein